MLIKATILIRFEETNEKSTRCLDGEKCIGGYARLVTIVRDLMSEQEKNPIYLNAGDNFQGTFWYTIGRWNVTNHFLNLLPADAMVRHLITFSIYVNSFNVNSLFHS